MWHATLLVTSNFHTHSVTNNLLLRLYPIIVPDVNLCYKMLNARGVDAYLGATQLRVVHAPVGSKFAEPDQTNNFFNKVRNSTFRSSLWLFYPDPLSSDSQRRALGGYQTNLQRSHRRCFHREQKQRPSTTQALITKRLIDLQYNKITEINPSRPIWSYQENALI